MFNILDVGCAVRCPQLSTASSQSNTKARTLKLVLATYKRGAQY